MSRGKSPLRCEITESSSAAAAKIGCFSLFASSFLSSLRSCLFYSPLQSPDGAKIPFEESEGGKENWPFGRGKWHDIVRSACACSLLCQFSTQMVLHFTCHSGWKSKDRGGRFYWIRVPKNGFAMAWKGPSILISDSPLRVVELFQLFWVLV